VGALPPGCSWEVRHAKARSYKRVRTSGGGVLPSAAAAWRAYNATAGSQSQPAAAPPAVGPERSLSDAVVAILRAFSFDPSLLPPHVSSLARLATCADCPDYLRRAAREAVMSSDVSAEAISAPRPAVVASPQGGSDEHARAREIRALRDVLPEGCEMRMLGSQAAYDQATRAIRESALTMKFNLAAGPRGANCARDRRALSRYMSFCQRAGVRRPWPVYSPTFAAFLEQAFVSSTGKKGGRCVKHGLKVAFVHLRDHFGLEAELEAPVLFNTVKAYKGDSDTATSPSFWALREWERLSAEHLCSACRTACQVAVLACWLSLRAIHFVGASVLPSSNSDDVRLNLARDKDGSTNVWAGCDAAGLLGAFSWWPLFAESAVARGFLVPAISVEGIDNGDGVKASLLPHAATSRSMGLLWDLAFVLIGLPVPEQRTLRFTGHSARHFLPCLAEILMWTQALRDEVGRWSTGAANAKRVKCGPRYTVAANRALQVFLRRQLRLAAIPILEEAALGSGAELLIPNFHDLADSPVVQGSPYFRGPSFVPGFGAVP
jgi:hypothetical protein